MSARKRTPRGSVRVRIGRSVAAVALCSAGLVLAAAFLGITVQTNALAREKASLQAEIAGALGDQASLRQHIETQKTDDYVTQMARRLGLIGQNETLFAIRQDGQASGESSSASVKPSRLAKWVSFFFGAR